MLAQKKKSKRRSKVLEQALETIPKINYYFYKEAKKQGRWLFVQMKEQMANDFKNKAHRTTINFDAKNYIFLLR